MMRKHDVMKAAPPARRVHRIERTATHYMSGAPLDAKMKAEVRGTFIAIGIIFVIAAAGFLGVYYAGMLLAQPTVEMPELAPHERIQAIFSNIYGTVRP